MKSEFRLLKDRAKILYNMLSIKAFRKKKYPFYVNLVINSKCNLKCAYCFGSYHNRHNPDLSFEKFKELIKTLKQKKVKYILMQGGEPFLHPDLGKMIQYLYDNKIVCAIVSNGQFPEKIKKIKELNLMDNICFSLDGAENGNDKIRGKGCFAKVKKSIDECKKYLNIPIRISSTIHKFVLNDIDFMASFIKNNNLQWGINFLFKGTEKINNESLAIDKENLFNYINKLIYYKNKGIPIFTTKKVLFYVFKWLRHTDKLFLSKKELENINFGKCFECQYGNYEIVIDEDLKIYPCQAMQGVFNAKSLKDFSFDEAFKHLENKPCYSCYIPSMINTSMMINWDFDVITETILDTFKDRLKNEK